MDTDTAKAHFGYDRELLARLRSAFDGKVASPAEARDFMANLIGNALHTGPIENLIGKGPKPISG